MLFSETAAACVAGELETAALSGEDAGEQPHQRARVAATDWSVGRRQPTQPDAVHHELVVGGLVHLDAEAADGGDRRLGVGRAPESLHVRLVLAERTDQHGAVRDRLVTGDGDVSDQGSRRLDLHSSSTAETTTW